MTILILHNGKYLILTICAVAILILQSCAGLQRYDDAVRIREDAAADYYELPKGKGIRDGNTLKGTVVKVLITSRPDSCPVGPETNFINDTTVVFLDEKLPNEPVFYESIPFENISGLASLFDMPDNGYNNINIFENYNNPDKIRGTRAVPVDTVTIDTCSPCDCREFTFNPDLDLNFSLSIKCPERDFKWYFIELRGGYAVFNDISAPGRDEGRDAWPLEIAAGFRFGGQKQWGLGLAFSTGIKSYNSFKAEDLLRPVVLIHGRYQASKANLFGLCLRPFAYAQMGIPIDGLSIDLVKFKYSEGCSKCRKYIEELKVNNLIPDVDFSLPLSYGIGAGFDLPISSFIDLSFDVGFRSLGFGEAVTAAGFDNVPSMRRINMLLFRFGVTI